MLERMDDFFAARIEGYEEHMKTEIRGGSEFYDFTAALLPKAPGARVLDLGCGTGLELEALFALNPTAKVTGIDLSPVMLDALRAKFPEKDVTLIQGSYFDVPFGEAAFDAAVSVESLHHFPADDKEALYRRLCAALADGGVFALTDYFAESDEMEKLYFRELDALRREQGLSGDVIVHYDTPLTIEHEMAILRRAGFAETTVLKKWGGSYTLVAKK